MKHNNAFDILKERGFISQVTDESAVREMFDAGPVTCYNGFDPTAESLQVGNLVPIMALAQLQRTGHRPIAILGGGTAMVGDPSGRTELRQLLSSEAIQGNIKKIQAQLSRYIDFNSNAITLDNSEWLFDLSYIDFLREIGRHFSVNRMLAAEAYRIRLESGLSFLEFNYQILQAYDYLILFRKYGCRLQMGGDEQWGNILAGTELIRRVEGADVHAVTFPLVTTADGKKMGKTAAGAVWLDAQWLSPYDFYQYWINIDDPDVERFLGLFTFLPMEQVRQLGSLEGAELRKAKEVLAFETTRITHGDDAAEKARAASRAAFGGGSEISELPTFRVSSDLLNSGLTALNLFANVMDVSKSEARRLIQQGGAYLNDRRVENAEESLKRELLDNDPLILRAGKKKIYRVVME